MITKNDLVLGGHKVDARRMEARQFKMIAGGFLEQLGKEPTQAERILVINAATFAVLCEEDCLKVMQGEKIDRENFRRNSSSLNAALVRLGLVKKSRDVTAQDFKAGGNNFASALIEATADSEDD